MTMKTRVRASLIWATLSVMVALPSVSFADTSAKHSMAPKARPAVAIAARPAAKPANEKPARIASTSTKKHSTAAPALRKVSLQDPAYSARPAGARAATIAPNKSHGRLWCVPFAREATGINIQGNAKTWWASAENRYEKGQKPVVGSVLNFRATKGMPMGHVAVVSHVVNSRKILVDHANWQKNRISLNMAVVDVSSRNDWSAVRVETVPNTLGSVYPTYGFIYRTADNG